VIKKGVFHVSSMKYISPRTHMSIVTQMLPIATILLFKLVLLSSHASANYILKDSFKGKTFFDKFKFFTDNDPTHGYVDYISQEAAQSSGLVNIASDGKVFMGADSKNIASGRGRKSVRIESTVSYNAGSLIIFDVEHAPFGCGTWPAFWLVGDNWRECSFSIIASAIYLHFTNMCSKQRRN
jgi:hypothetical protein